LSKLRLELAKSIDVLLVLLIPVAFSSFVSVYTKPTLAGPTHKTDERLPAEQQTVLAKGSLQFLATRLGESLHRGYTPV
jgi:hypothetical protein